MAGLFASSAGRTAAESAALLGRMIRRDARSETAGRWVAEAAHEVDGRDVVKMARALATRLRGAVAYAHDEYGRDDPQRLHETIERTAGDCEDFAVAFAALALRAGARVGLAVGFDAAGRPAHVVPTIEAPGGGDWLPVELTDPTTPFGSWPARAGGWECFEVVAPGAGGLGFLDAVLGAVAGIFGGSQQAKAAKAQAKATKDAAKVQAKAVEKAATEQRAAVEFAEREKTARWQMVGLYVRETAPMLVAAAGAFALPALVGAFTGTSRKRR